MKSRSQRLLAIRKIIETEAIGSQDELLAKLVKAGLPITQATLSRDLKFLGVGKVPHKDQGYIYMLTGNEMIGKTQSAGLRYPLNGFVSIDFAWNMAVIRTQPGFANSIASAIDRLNAYEILGTIAGDDTILLIPREGCTQIDIKNKIAIIFPEADFSGA